MENPINASAATAGSALGGSPPPVDPYGSPYQAFPQQQRHPVVDNSISPGLAFLLGLIPGVGAIYNGQYAKGLVHVVVLGLLITIINSRELNGGFEPLFGISIATWFFYMAFEAYHTAKRRMLGQRVDEFSSLIHLNENASALPIGPIVLIAVGVFFLLANFDLIRVRDIMRFWPLGLIAIGSYMLYLRMSNRNSRN